MYMHTRIHTHIYGIYVCIHTRMRTHIYGIYMYIYTHTYIYDSVSITEDGKQALLTLANGDMRKVLNVLQ